MIDDEVARTVAAHPDPWDQHDALTELLEATTGPDRAPILRALAELVPERGEEGGAALAYLREVHDLTGEVSALARAEELLSATGAFGELMELMQQRGTAPRAGDRGADNIRSLALVAAAVERIDGEDAAEDLWREVLELAPEDVEARAYFERRNA